MNIEQIAAEVTRELMTELYLENASQAPGIPFSRVLLVFSRSDLDLTPIKAKLAKWQKKAAIQVIAPRWAQNLWGANPFEGLDIPISYRSFDSGGDKVGDLVSQADRVAVVGITGNILHKVAFTQRENFVSGLVLEALGRNKTVLILDDQIETYPKTDKVMTMGVRLGTLNDLEHIFPLPPMPVSVSNPVLSLNQGKPLPANCQGCDLHGHCATLCSDRVRQLVSAGAERIGTALGMHPVPQDLASYIDHTLLKAEATEAQIKTLCAEAKQYNFASVCVNPSWVPLCAKLLHGTPVMVCTVIGFPLGATDTATKADETRHAIANGAQEIDMVINVGALKSGQLKKVEDDIRAVVQAAQGRTVKVILETALLSDSEKVTACQLSEAAGAHFVKTSTGFGPGGATEGDVALMRRTVKKEMQVKASGSIRDRETTLRMIQAGATRIGASAGIAIVKGTKASGDGKY